MHLFIFFVLKMLKKNCSVVIFKSSQETDQKVSAETERRVEKRKRPKGWKRKRLEKASKKQKPNPTKLEKRNRVRSWRKNLTSDTQRTRQRTEPLALFFLFKKIKKVILDFFRFSSLVSNPGQQDCKRKCTPCCR